MIPPFGARAEPVRPLYRWQMYDASVDQHAHLSLLIPPSSSSCSVRVDFECSVRCKGRWQGVLFICQWFNHLPRETERGFTVPHCRIWSATRAPAQWLSEGRIEIIGSKERPFSGSLQEYYCLKSWDTRHNNWKFGLMCLQLSYIHKHNWLIWICGKIFHAECCSNGSLWIKATFTPVRYDLMKEMAPDC